MKSFLIFILAITLFFSFSSQSVASGKNDSKSETGFSTAENGLYTIKLTKAKFLAEVWDYQNSPKEWKFKGKKPVLIDFYADWCGPCRTAAPILEEIAKEYYGKIVIYKIDTTVEQELAQIFGVQGIPAFLYIPVTGKPSMTSGIKRTKEETKKVFIENIENLLLGSQDI